MAMSPFWMESVWSSLPQLLLLLAASVSLFMHLTSAAPLSAALAFDKFLERLM